ncbi:MAG: hypothetical protein M1832_000146 [Thelocarpon impressellum]|nr:MAG: hypothetical protein M1832_000146 [Thelocarpon impressellum]
MGLAFKLAAAAAVAYLGVVRATDGGKNAAPEDCCAALASAFGGRLFAPNSTQYDASIESYFTLQERLTPTCVVGPESAQDVAKIVRLLAKKSCLFAVRGGGHSLIPGAANIEDGVTIDLSAMNRVSLSKDRKTASIGPGCRWGDVYSTLSPQGVAVTGGRAATVGVSGLILGGGNSFFAARRGFACDNVKNFELVLGSGEIIDVNAQTHPDLFRCLKGGSGNFGIVTRFDLFAFEQGDIWGGTVAYAQSTGEQHLRGFYEFTKNIRKDPYASLINIWSYAAAGDAQTIVNAFEYTKAEAYPPPFESLVKIKPQLGSSMRITNLTDITTELESPTGLRNSFHTLTFKNDLDVLKGVNKIVQDALAEARRDPKFISWAYGYQPLPRVFTERSLENGGNILGLEDEKDDNVLFLWFLAWDDPAQDGPLAALAKAVTGAINEYTKKQKAYVQFEYLPYADAEGNPLRKYGSNNLRKMRRVSREYDPDQVFQKLVPGGFKLATAGDA